jgi:hypothetical protein
LQNSFQKIQRFFLPKSETFFESSSGFLLKNDKNFRQNFKNSRVENVENKNVEHQFLNTRDATFSINLGENQKILSMLLVEQELSKYLVSKFVLKYNIRPWGVFHPVCCWCMLLWVVSSVYVAGNCGNQSFPEMPSHFRK